MLNYGPVFLNEFQIDPPLLPIDHDSPEVTSLFDLFIRSIFGNNRHGRLSDNKARQHLVRLSKLLVFLCSQNDYLCVVLLKVQLHQCNAFTCYILTSSGNTGGELLSRGDTMSTMGSKGGGGRAPSSSLSSPILKVDEVREEVGLCPPWSLSWASVKESILSPSLALMLSNFNRLPLGLCIIIKQNYV